MTCPHLAYRSEGDGQSFDVERVACVAEDLGREVASPAQARELLGL